LKINLFDKTGDWAGILESNVAGPAEASRLIGLECELIMVSARREQRHHKCFCSEIENCEALKNVILYEFYGIFWVEWIEAVAYKKAIGRVWKRIWDKQGAETVDVILG
jgi:hypothetical protein